MRDPFFIEGLAQSLLGEEVEDPTARARRFLAPAVLEHSQAIREAFLESGKLKHVCLSDVLRPRLAHGVGEALHAARFRRHHHAAYRIEVAPLDALVDSSLRRFCRWLATDDAARFHSWLTGWPATTSRQVQVARARRGDEFPVHVDMAEEGLAAVYNFSESFGEDDGGVLHFPGAGIRLPPIFNTLIVFRPKRAPHGVTRITGRKTRFSVTAFFG